MLSFLGRALREYPSVIAALIIGVSLIVGTVIVSNMVIYVKTFNNSMLAVTGTAEQVVVSDEVKWTSDFSTDTTRGNLQAGYAQMSHDLSLVRAFLAKNGVSAGDITVTPVSINQSFMNCKFNPASCSKAALAAYTLDQTVTVQSSHVNKVTALAQEAGSLAGQGVFFSTQSVKYYYNKLAGLRVKLIAAAVLDAQRRAQRIAADTGVKLGRLVSVNTGVLQLTPVNSTQMFNSGSYDTTTIKKKLTSVVNASFRLGG